MKHDDVDDRDDENDNDQSLIMMNQSINQSIEA
jgi:hypothetical protein